jgi:hypothetical protein
MNQTYLKYGLIVAAVIVVLYALMKGGTSSAQSAGSGGAVAVDVQYSGSVDQGESIAARSGAFSELIGLTGLITQEQSALEQSADANRTARSIAAGDEATTRYGLDIGRQIEELRIRGARDLAEFQASQVNFAAESFRNKDVGRAANYLNALTSIWGAAPTYVPESQRPSTAAAIVNSITNAASKFFTLGLG